MQRSMQRKWIKWGLGASIIGMVPVMIESFMLEKYFFETRAFNIGNGNGTGKLKMLLLSDLHLQRRLWPHHIRIARKVNELNPDIIILTGDILDTFGKASTAHR